MCRKAGALHWRRVQALDYFLAALRIKVELLPEASVYKPADITSCVLTTACLSVFQQQHLTLNEGIGFIFLRMIIYCWFKLDSTHWTSFWFLSLLHQPDEPNVKHFSAVVKQNRETFLMRFSSFYDEDKMMFKCFFSYTTFGLHNNNNMTQTQTTSRRRIMDPYNSFSVKM